VFVKLDDDVIDILCCPLCKSTINMIGEKFVCKDCGTEYPKYNVVGGKHKEYVFDFRIHRPAYCIPDIIEKWVDMQEEYKKFHSKHKSIDDLTVYLDEVDSVKEIYTKEFNIKGKVLDVGGGQGRLRYFLKDKDVPLYVSIDPYLEIFQNLEYQPNLLKAYSCLCKPCNFLSGYAENLPFTKNSFDWIHMRSVLDHLYDPYLALKEAYRVLKADGTLLIGLTVRGGQSSLRTNSKQGNNTEFISIISKIRRKFRNEGLIGLARAAKRSVMREKEKERENNITDDHMFRWAYEDLIDLVYTTGFKVVKEHWQKPPFTMCIYLSAKKR
jgi:ubiquinone/menaquinone biosynthesis C-methylase UbiE